MDSHFERLLNTYNEYRGKIKTELNALPFGDTGKCSAAIDVRIIPHKGHRHFGTKSDPKAKCLCSPTYQVAESHHQPLPRRLGIQKMPSLLLSPLCGVTIYTQQSNQNEVTVEKAQMKAIRNPHTIPCPPQKGISAFWGEARVEGTSL